MKTNALKIIAGTLVVVGVVLGFFEHKYAPITMDFEWSPKYPAWLRWAGYWVTSISATAYVVIDIVATKSEKKRKKHQPPNAP